jgi:hypothetical protein
MARFSNCAMFETRNFFIMFARCDSPVFALMPRRSERARFVSPAQIY